MSDGASGGASAEELLERGTKCLAAGDRAEADRLLHAARELPATRLAAHNLIEEQALGATFAEMFGLECRIAPDDDIFQFFAHHPTSTNPLRDYLADGWRTLAELTLLLEGMDRSLLGCDSILEFASGHGRFTRHLVKAVGAERVTVSDVVPSAVAFAHDVLGAQGFVSDAEPEHVRWPRRYTLVFVLSLFSHLPRGTWSRWLRQLWSAVEPGGILVFSTHGAEAVRRVDVTLDASGFFFAPSSESTAIAAQEYGTAFTSEAFVRAAIADLPDQPAAVRFAPTWFWNHQDAWALQRPASR